MKVWVSAGPRSSIVPALVGESDRTAQMRVQQDGFDREQPVRRSGRRNIPRAPSSRRRRRPKSQSERVALLVNRGERGATYVMPDLIGVNGDRAADVLRARGFRVAVVGDQPYPGVPAGVVLRQTPQAGFQIAPGRSDLARGQPVSVLIAPSILAADFASLGDARSRAVERGGADLHPRRRDGRALRAEHHHGPAGRQGHQARRARAARRAPDDRGSGPLPRGVRRGRRRR